MEFLHRLIVWGHGGDHSYCSMQQSLGFDWTTIIALSCARCLLFVSYLVIALQFRITAKKLSASPEKSSLVDLVLIFLVCDICGYAWPQLKLFWPAADRLEILPLAGLIILTLRYICRGGLGNVFAAIATAEHDRLAAEQFRAIADGLPVMIWTARPDGYIDWYNARWYQYTGKTIAEMEGWGWQSVHDPKELPRVMQLWQESLSKGVSFEATFPLRGKNSIFRWFLTRVSPVRDPAGNLIRWIGSNTDVEHTHRNQQQNSSVLAALEKLTLEMNSGGCDASSKK